ncbi:spermidine synthase [Haloechinothrix sp. YIM 98757]|uniref:Spermidine synthase n=1 Tax=Haloechinothrix aidingensis TaxID=2752311 RepID=A0A838AFU0_9PSEU|nr:spermidine synthase [Haloechinothrix aidingensis]
MAEVIDTADGVCGVIALRSADEHYEVIADGVFLMDTRDGESERLMITSVADEIGARQAGCARVLIGGLGVGYSLRAALDHPAVGEVVVVEREKAVVAWNTTGPLRQVHGDALADDRVRVVEADLLEWLGRTDERFDALCMDIDNGPSWTVSESNAELYTPDGVELMWSRLRAGGLLSVWGAQDDATFTARLRAQFAEVRTETVEVRRGEPDVVWVARRER